MLNICYYNYFCNEHLYKCYFTCVWTLLRNWIVGECVLIILRDIAKFSSAKIITNDPVTRNIGKYVFLFIFIIHYYHIFKNLPRPKMKKYLVVLCCILFFSDVLRATAFLFLSNLYSFAYFSTRLLAFHTD